MNNEITLHENKSSLGFLQVNSIGEAMKVGEMIKQSGFAPKSMSVVDIVLAMQMGIEVGLKPLQAVQNISVINGKPSLWGDAMIALCKQHPDWEWAKETYDAVTQTARCVVKRKGEPEVVSEFSMERAKKAGLVGKSGPWTQYPERMLQMRARGFALRDAFPDALKGLISTEEARDYPERKDLSKEPGHVIEAQVVEGPMGEETLKTLLGYMAAHETSEEVIKQWCDQNKVTRLKDIPESYAQRIISMFVTHEEKLRHLEAEQQQPQHEDAVYHV